ncbi:MAG: hypothetical protein JWP87_6037 [Labilithrix sp.]|nr:hypothetical protein [Labilithrix sp.]
MKLTELAAFDVAHAHLAWPWIAFDPSGTSFAFASSARTIVTRVLGDASVTDGPTFSLAEGMSDRLDAFAIGAGGALLAVSGTAEGASALVTSDATGEKARTALEALTGPGFVARALAFDRSGARLWISAESHDATALVLVDARTHALVGIARSAVFPPPSLHELALHPVDDAVLLLAACGEDGTFARVAGWSGGGVEPIATALDAGSLPAGFVGFSADGARVHLAEADELRTHAWPGLEELSSVELADDFVSSFSGAVLGEKILVDGEDAETHEDAVMMFDRSGIVGSLVHDDVPRGMWAGRLGRDCIVTVEAKGEPARGRVLRVTL